MFVSDKSETATRADLILGVLICSMTFDEFNEFLTSPKYIKSVKKWGKKCGIFDLPSKARLFSEYLREAQRVPKFWIETEETEQSGSHWSQALITTLHNAGYSRDDALSVPLGQALYDFYKYAESMRAVRLMTEEEIASIETLETASQQEVCNGS